ncbi:zinc finger and SCAN domain-containing protein 31-like isoform X2 [Tiliqua scincoides]|uniref:zinc finger and SCAN domain-containing protein 31-like isoform X2 n=1 Tax=Tiliqua scincoides TaxID=71010 RepID=UPI003462A59F
MTTQQHGSVVAASPGEAADLMLPLQVRVKMEAQCSVDGSTTGEDGKCPYTIQPEATEELSREGSALRVKQELVEKPLQKWDCQWQRVLEVVPTPVATPVWDHLQLPPLTQGGNTEAYLATFEQVADASQWPRDEWVTRLVPVLNGQAQQAYFGLDPKDKGDYGKVKVAILRLDDFVTTEAHRQGFRHFCYQDAEGPRGTCRQLQELCHRWLRPESQTKEQILDLLILEQFLVILPQEMQDWIRERGPESCDQAVALAEVFLQEQRETKRWEQQMTVPIEMVIVNSPIVDQALSDTEQRHLHSVAQQADNTSSSQESNFATQTGIPDVHQGEIEVAEQGRVSPGQLGEGAFPRSDPRRACMSEHGIGRQQKSYLSMRMIADQALEGILTDPEAKRHLCKECGKRFRKKWDLIRHERIHTAREDLDEESITSKPCNRLSTWEHFTLHPEDKRIAACLRYEAQNAG